MKRMNFLRRTWTGLIEFIAMHQLPIMAFLILLVIAFPFMTKIMRLLNFSNVHAFMIATGITIAVFAVVYVIVYAVTARTYYNIVEE